MCKVKSWVDAQNMWEYLARPLTPAWWKVVSEWSLEKVILKYEQELARPKGHFRQKNSISKNKRLEHQAYPKEVQKDGGGGGGGA